MRAAELALPDTSSGGATEPSLRFDRPVPDDGYAWWYVDALSDDGRHGLTVIAFLGGVFSPYYAFARRRGPTDPLNHVAMNAVLYGANGKRFAMTERRRDRLTRDASSLSIGPSSLDWSGERLTIHLDERAAPLPRPIRGTVTLDPVAMTARDFALDVEEHHRWWPIAPRARVEVALTRPALRWQGTAYFDTNAGSVPLERSFRRWDWARLGLKRGGAILYNVTPTAGAPRPLALKLDPSGGIETFAPPPPAALPNSFWRLRPETRAEDGLAPRLVEGLEDVPFYTRSVIETRVLGETVRGVHEQLDLARFAAPWVQALLPFRTPRVPW